MNKKIVIFFWAAVLSFSLFCHHQSVKKEVLFSHFSSSKKKVIILKDERWDFSWKEQILHFIIIFIIFSFLITVIMKKYNDYKYDLDEKGTVRFLTRLRFKNISPFKLPKEKESNSFDAYKILVGGGRKGNLFGTSGKCFFIEYFFYFQIFYNVLFFLLDCLIFPIIKAFLRKKKTENLMDCVGDIIKNKFYISEDGLEFNCMIYISPMVIYVLYRLLAFLVIRIVCVFDDELASRMYKMACEEGEKIIQIQEEREESDNKNTRKTTENPDEEINKEKSQ